eukprot:7360298-Prymnesium_polylepis.1
MTRSCRRGTRHTRAGSHPACRSSASHSSSCGLRPARPRRSRPHRRASAGPCVRTPRSQHDPLEARLAPHFWVATVARSGAQRAARTGRRRGAATRLLPLCCSGTAGVAAAQRHRARRICRARGTLE